MNRIVTAAIAAAVFIAPAFAASTDTYKTIPTDSGVHRSSSTPLGTGLQRSDAAPRNAAGVSPSTGTLPGSSFPSWTEIKGEVVAVDGNTLRIRQAGDTVIQSLPVTGNVTIHNEKMKAISLKSVKPGQTVILQNGSTTTPAPQPVAPR